MTENIDPNVGSINLLVQAAFDDDDDFYFIASPKKLRKIEDSGKTLKEIKFKELPDDLKEVLHFKIPNTWTKDGFGSRINNRIRVKEGWRGNYDCAIDKKNCPYKGSITVSADGLSDPILFIKTDHNCCGGQAVVCQELINAQDDMADMVKNMALDNQGWKALDIANQVMKHFILLCCNSIIKI